MDAVNVFIMNGADTFGFLVLFGCNYIGFVSMIENELKVDRRHSYIKIKYNADVEISPIWITIDKSLQFYWELNRRDQCITVYALRINMIEILQSTNCINKK